MPFLSISDDTKRLTRLAGAMFTLFLAIGIPLPVIPLYVRHELDLSDTMVGLVIGIQFLATILTRGYAGRVADERGAKRSVMQGMLSCSIAGLFYLAPVFLPVSVMVKFSFLIVFTLNYGLRRKPASDRDPGLGNCPAGSSEIRTGHGLERNGHLFRTGHRGTARPGCL